jgi:xylulokinase
MQRSILSVDIGSSSCKAVLFDEWGNEQAMGKGYYPYYYPEPSQVEQIPVEIWKGFCGAIAELRQSLKEPSHISAVSLSGQISSYFFVDQTGNPLTNVISWQDSRACVEAEEMKQSFSDDQLLHLLGAEMPVGPSWPIPKLRWFHNYQPDVVEKASYFVQPKDWILWMLTKEWSTDRSSLRGMLHQLNGTACDELFQWAGARNDLLPEVREPFEVAGTLISEVALLLNLPTGIPVITGWNDLNACVLGTTGITKGVGGFDITGTSEHIGVITERSLPVEELKSNGITYIPFLNKHHLSYGVTSSGGHALQWYVQQIDQWNKTPVDYNQVMQSAGEIEAGAGGLLFLPYLNGERSPWWNPVAKGVLFGLQSKHDRRHIARSVLEGVCYTLRAIYEPMDEVPGMIRISGGTSRFDLWNQTYLKFPLKK